MPDNGVIGAMVIAVAGAVTAAGSAIKGITDVKSTKDLLEIIGGEDGKGGLLGKLIKRVEELAGLIDPRLRADLDETIGKVEDLVSKVSRYRAETRAAAAGRGLPVQQTGSFPTVETVQALSLRLDDLDRRVKAAEDLARRNEERLDRIDDFVGLARESLATIKAHLQHLLKGTTS